MDQGSTRKRSAVHNFAHTVTKFCVMWEGQALPHDTKFGNSRCEIVGRRVIFIWSLIHGSSWSGLIKVGPGQHSGHGMTKFIILVRVKWNPSRIFIMMEDSLVDTLRPKQNGRQFVDDIFKCIFVNENVWISMKISLKLFLIVQLTIFQHWFR